jgi:DNA-binding CsgD family transcriptional regulator
VTVKAVGMFGQTALGYTPAVTISTTDPDPGVLQPSAYTFTTADHSTHTASGGFTPVADRNLLFVRPRKRGQEPLCEAPFGPFRQRFLTPFPGLIVARFDREFRITSPLQKRSRFETFLADLSATFINVSADQVDSQIVAGLRQIVEFLGIDRSGFGELVADDNKLAITHSYEVANVPPTPRIYVEAHWPDYACKVRQGMAFRVPEDLPAEATAEREYLAQVGLKSQFTIPLRMAGAVVGAIGFASFRSHLEWPEDLVLRLGLMGDIFNYALARKHAYEALQRANQRVRALRKKLASANRQLRAAVEHAHQHKSQELARQQEASRIRQLLDSLKPREREVFLLVAAGKLNKQIGARLGVSLHTVKLHRGRLMRKLQLNSVAELVRLAETARSLLPSL